MPGLRSNNPYTHPFPAEALTRQSALSWWRPCLSYRSRSLLPSKTSSTGAPMKPTACAASKSSALSMKPTWPDGRCVSVDPANRLVASQLEAERNSKLRILAEEQEEYENLRVAAQTHARIGLLAFKIAHKRLKRAEPLGHVILGQPEFQPTFLHVAHQRPTGSVARYPRGCAGSLPGANLLLRRRPHRGILPPLRDGRQQLAQRPRQRSAGSRGSTPAASRAGGQLPKWVCAAPYRAGL